MTDKTKIDIEVDGVTIASGEAYSLPHPYIYEYFPSRELLYIPIPIPPTIRMENKMAAYTSDPLRVGRLQCDTSALGEILHLPEGYKVVRMFMENDQTINFIITSDELPEMIIPDGEAREIPLVRLCMSVDTLPLYPGYRKITTEIKTWEGKE